MKGFALDYLDPIQLAQLQATRPDLHLGVPQCQRCHNGQVVSGSCLQCGQEHNENNELIMPDEDIGLVRSGFHSRVFIQ